MTSGNVHTVYRALADPTRRAILDYLRQGPQAVSAITERFPISRPAVSKHLRMLRRARLVIQQKHGRERIQHLNAKPLRRVEQWLSTYRRLWSTSLAALKEYLEENPNPPEAEVKSRAQRRH